LAWAWALDGLWDGVEDVDVDGDVDCGLWMGKDGQGWTTQQAQASKQARRGESGGRDGVIDDR